MGWVDGGSPWEGVPCPAWCTPGFIPCHFLLCSALSLRPQAPAVLLVTSPLLLPAGFLSWETEPESGEWEQGETARFPTPAMGSNSGRSCISHDSTSHQAGQPWPSVHPPCGPGSWAHPWFRPLRFLLTVLQAVAFLHLDFSALPSAA